MTSEEFNRCDRLGWALLTGVRLYLNQRTTPIATAHAEPAIAA